MHPRLSVTFACLVVISGAIGAGVGTVAGLTDAARTTTQDAPCRGTISDPANGTTVVSVQGARFGEDRGKTQAKLVGFGPHGRIKWTYNHTDDVVWSYDIDPLPNGNLFVTATRPSKTDLFEFNPRTQERVWTRVLDLVDTHDADMLNNSHIAVANMRNYDEEREENRDRLLIYDRQEDEIVWEWRFADHYDRTVGGNYTEDWTHVNDIDAVGDRYFLASPRNFDQVILVDRRTGEIVRQLGSYRSHDVLRKQHNPDYIESDAGQPTILVADSENDRVVEYEQGDGDDWRRTWMLSGSFNWPRDADRLPNGNTLVSDSRNNRVLEVTPAGEVVWEVYAPWLVYDAERLRHGDGSTGPTVADQDAAGTAALSGDAGFSESETEACDRALSTFDGEWEPIGTPTPTRTPATEWERTDPEATGVAPGTALGLTAVAIVFALLIAVSLYRRLE